MKQWRVGTISMGVSLVMLGIMLFLSQWRGLAALDTFLTWWPLIFVLLGLELLIYLAVHRSSTPVVRYDIFSVFFVGFICMVCIGFVVLASTGVMQEIKHEINSIERTIVIPSVEEKLQAQVKKVVVQNYNYSQVLVDSSPSQVSDQLIPSDQAVHVFGSYQYSLSDGETELALPDSIFTIRTIGDTIYVSIHQPPQRNGMRGRSAYMNVTVVIPDGVLTEITGNHKFI